jgi:Ser-tRNA(Ala) deacylase AlaX
MAGQSSNMRVDQARRSALSRYYAVLHLVNTIYLRDYGAWITSAQIDVEYARIDFKREAFSASLCSDIEGRVDAEVTANTGVLVLRGGVFGGTRATPNACSTTAGDWRTRPSR